jgi:hypothetical protein
VEITFKLFQDISFTVWIGRLIFCTIALAEMIGGTNAGMAKNGNGATGLNMTALLTILS